MVVELESWSEVQLLATPRPAQQRLLELAAVPELAADRKLHLAAPPGTGKTLVGLELARRLGQPALVLVPSSPLVERWRAELLARFGVGGQPLADRPELADRLISTDPSRPATITISTYQAVSVPARPGPALDGLARRAWERELAEEGDRDAVATLDAMERAEPTRYRRLLRRRAASVRRQLTRDGHVDVLPLLHANAQGALAALADRGVGTVVLDECHHLLDHWALVVAAFLETLPGAHVVGLTATLPDPADQRRQARYEQVLGPVDIEIPVPAVVREGGLAPYRQLTLPVTLTDDEAALLDDLEGRFRDATREVTSTEAFRTWLVGQAVHDDGDGLARWLVDEPALSRAVLRAHQHWMIAPPQALPLPADSHEPLDESDLLVLLGRFHTDVLHGSPDPALAAVRQDLVATCSAFGVALTRRGVRQARSSVDQLLARSHARTDAAARVLAAEHAVLGDRLRAVVAVDVDRAPHPHALLRGVLEADAGSARQLHRRLATDARTGPLGPVLMTSRTVRVGNVLADELASAVNLALGRAGADAWCRAVPVDDRVQELQPHGRDWTTRAVLPVLTRLLEDGLFRVLVATRGLVGQGWDAPSLNVLVDLTQVASAVASPQLHGRTLRLDPDDPAKVAHNWDVVAMAPGRFGADGDVARWRRRHRHLWGITVAAPSVLVRDVAHAGPAGGLATGGSPTTADVRRLADQALDLAGERAAVASAWRSVTPPGSGEVRAEVVVSARRSAGASVVLDAPRRPGGLLGVAAGGVALLAAGGLALTGLAPAALGAALAGSGLTVHGAVRRWTAGRRDAVGWRDGDGRRAGRLAPSIAGAVRDALVDVSALPVRARSAPVEVAAAGGSLVIRLGEPDGPPLAPAAHDTFATAIAAIMGDAAAIRDGRYVLRVGLPERPWWLPCPASLGGRREHADALAGRLADTLRVEVAAVFVRSPEGRPVVLRALAQAPAPLVAASRHVWA